MPCPQPALGSCLPISCCIGGAPWCSATPPGPILGLQRGHFASPAHSSGQTSGVCPGPRQGLLPSLGHRPAPPDAVHAPTRSHPPTLGRPPCRQPGSPRHLSHRLASPWLRVASLSHYPLQPPPSCQRTHPHRLALGWQEGPSCHPHPPSSTTSSSCDCRGGSGVKQTKRQNQTRYMQYLSVCTCKV